MKFVVVMSEWLRYVLDTEVKRVAEPSTELSNYQKPDQMPGKMPERPDKTQICSEVETRTPGVCLKFFDSHIGKHLSWILQEVGNMECEVVMFKPSIVKNCCQKVVRAWCDSNLRSVWWTHLLEGAVKLKTETFQARLTQQTPKLADSLWRP